MPLSNSGRYDDTLESNYLSVALSVSTTATEAKVGGSPLQGRQELLLFNDSSTIVYFGPPTVTSSGSNKGITLEPGEFLQIPIRETVSLYCITASGTATLIVQEIG